MPIPYSIRKKFYKGEAWEAVRAFLRERSGDKCEKCVSRNGAWGYYDENDKFVEVELADVPAALAQGHKITQIQCGAAHVNNTPGDDRPENLLWICRRCHLAFDFKHHEKSRQTRKDRSRPLLEEISA